jgi:hypothetical protein
MSRHILINAPGAGKWIMDRVQGAFMEERDSSITTHDDEGNIRGGFAFCDYLGASMTVHMAGNDEKWCSKDLLWMAFHYAFVQLGVRKLIAPVASNNYHALAIDLRGGWKLETVIEDAYPDAHMMVLTMTRASCPWLRIIPENYGSGPEVRAAREKELADGRG